MASPEHVSAAGDIVESLVDQLQDADRAVVRRAVDSLVALAAREPAVVGLLEQRLKDARIRWKWPVAYTLGLAANVSETCLDVLVKGLGSEDQDVRWATQRLMTRLGSEDGGARQILLELVREGSGNQRRMAVYCLRNIGAEAERGAEAILAACQDPDPLVRVAAVTSLLKLEKRAVSSILLLLRRLADGDADARVRNAARFVLKRLQEE